MKNRKGNHAMDISTLALLALTAGLIIYAFIKDKSMIFEGIKLAGATLWNNLLLLLIGFLLAGLVQVLIPKNLIVSWLGNQAGFKAVLIGCVAGGLIPGAPYAAFPIAAGFYRAGAGLGAMVGFITAWSLWSVTRLPVEIALISPKAAILRYAITFIFPPLAGFIAHIVSKTML